MDEGFDNCVWEVGGRRRIGACGGARPGQGWCLVLAPSPCCTPSPHTHHNAFPPLLPLFLPPPPHTHSGVYNDLGSGSNVDLCIITKEGVEYLRNYEYLQAKTYSRKFPVTYPPGTAREWGRGGCVCCQGPASVLHRAGLPVCAAVGHGQPNAG